MKKEKTRAKYVQMILKVIGSGLVAFLILNVFAYFYYFLPTKVKSDNAATDYCLQSNFTGYLGEEGFAKFTTDSNGYNNNEVPDSIDILVMGSSHTLGYNVAKNSNFSRVLETELKENGDTKSVYNIGMYAHTFSTCLSNLQAAVDTYQPNQYVIIETNTLSFNEGNLEKYICNESFELQQIDGTMVSKLKKIPYIQLLAHQYKNSEALEEGTNTSNLTQTTNQVDVDTYKTIVQEAMDKADATMKKANCKLIILYQPMLYLNADGSAYTKTNADYYDIFEKICNEKGITIVDMTDTFLSEYNTNHTLPHGFSNTSVGTGHMNTEGHYEVGVALADEILKENSLVKAKE